MSSTSSTSPPTHEPAPPSHLERIAHVLFELLLISGCSFILTAALLPLFNLHPSLWIVARVTIVCTALVVAAVEGIFGRQITDEEEEEGFEEKGSLHWREKHEMV